MKKSKIPLLFALVTSATSLAAGAAAGAPRKDALLVSYKTATTTRGLGGRFELVRKLEALGFRTTLVSDRFPERKDAIEPTPENFLAAFERLAADSEVRELAIVVDLHGVPRKRHERTHSVLFGKTELSLDRFRPGLRRLKKRGARVVLLDLSCFSGATLPLDRDGACVATDGAKTSENYTQFIDAFSEAILPGVSFEAAYLEARRNHPVPRTPRISSDAGRFAIGEENVIERAFAQETRSGALRFEKRVSRLAWTDEERVKVAESYEYWKTGGEIVPFTGLIHLPIYTQAALRYRPLVTAERSLYERNFRAYHEAEPEISERAASRACAEFVF